MATGLNASGQTVSVNDHVSITAKVVSFTGSGATAVVTVQAPQDAGTFSIQGNDCFCVEQPADVSHTVRSLSGNAYGVKGDDITVLGLVTAISGSGQSALLTVKLISSLNSITTAAGNCNSVTA